MSPIAKNGNNATNRDVARAAGVSVMTVSRVLNGNVPVRESTRERVLNACQELGYRPNLAAATLSNGKSRVIGVIVPHFALQFYSRLIQSITFRCSEFDYHVIPIYGYHGDSNVAVIPEQIEFLLARQVDGIVVAGGIDMACKNVLKEAEVPVIFADAYPSDTDFPYVGTDDFNGASTITKHLIDMGHTRIAVLLAAEGSYTAEQRYLGYKSALLAAGLRDYKPVFCGGFDLKCGFAGMSSLLDEQSDFTAVFAVTDYLALGAMSAIGSRGLRIPEDISVVGFTGDEIAHYTLPALTTMRQPIEEMGKAAVDMIMDPYKGYRKSTRMLLPASFVEGASVRRLAGEDPGTF